MVDLNQIKHEPNDIGRDLLLCGPLTPPEIPLLGDGEFGSFALRQGDPRLGTLPKNEDVGDPSAIHT